MRYSVIIIDSFENGNNIDKMSKFISTYERNISMYINDTDCKQIIMLLKKDTIRPLVGIVEKLKTNPTVKRNDIIEEEKFDNALMSVSEKNIIIHETLNREVSDTDLVNIKQALITNDACALMGACPDTMKEVKSGKVIKTIPRAMFMEIQSLHGYKTDLLRNVYHKATKVNCETRHISFLVQEFSDTKIAVLQK